MKSKTEILREHGIEVMELNDGFNSQVLSAMEAYASQFQQVGEEVVYVLADVKEVPLLQKEREVKGFIPIDGDEGKKWLKPTKLKDIQSTIK